jgi:hypothetical protein
MQRRDFWRLLAGAALSGLLPPSARALTGGDAGAGIRETLRRGAEAAVSLLGRPDGFLGNDKVRIALPGHLNDAAKLLKGIGQGKRVDDLVTAMNRAAEAAVPAARTLLVDTAKNIGFNDAVRIVRAGDNSVTEYFARQTRAPLSEKFLPIVTTATERVALADKYNAVAGKASGLGVVKKEDANIQQYVTRKALDGLYVVIGEEEKKIRDNPVGTGSALLKRVFGA